MFLLGAIAARAQAPADVPTARTLAARHAALVAFGVPASDGSMRLGLRAAERCGRAPATTICAVAEAAYDLAAARAALGDAEALARSLAIEPVRLEGGPGLDEARRLLPALAARLARLERRLRTVSGDEAAARATLVRLVEERLRTEASTLRTLAGAATDLAATNDGSPATAAALADEAIAAAIREDDAYVGRTRRATARSRASDRAAAAAAIAQALPARIATRPEAERARLEAALTAARAMPEIDARLAALLAILAELDAAPR